MPATQSPIVNNTDEDSSWKYLVQPSYAKIGSVVYHQNREIRLEMNISPVKGLIDNTPLQKTLTSPITGSMITQ